MRAPRVEMQAPTAPTAPELSGGAHDDDDDDGSGNDNRLITLFRGMMGGRGMARGFHCAGLLVCSVAFLVVLMIDAAVKWNARPPWIKKVPCVLQPNLGRVESTITSIERYFMLSDLVAPAATLVFVLAHLLASRALTDREYQPPDAKWMVLIWMWKILSPLIGQGPLSHFSAPARVLRRMAAFLSGLAF